MEWIWAAALLSIGVTGTAAYLLPRRLIPQDLGPEALERRRAQIEVAKVVAEVLAASFFLVTLLGSWYQLRSTQEQLAIAQRGQVAERYTRAVDQLGSTNPTIRAGGIFALGSIAKDSPQDHETVMVLLSTFLQVEAPVSDKFDERDWQSFRGAVPLQDLSAAASVIGRRNLSNERPLPEKTCSRLGGDNFPCILNLRGADFSAMDLAEANLDHADLTGSAFNHANMPFASFRFADLQGADLRGANLRLADLTGANLTFAILDTTNLHLAVGLTCEQLGSARQEGSGAVNLTIEC